mmetsp:Transcript_25987/g.56641  ORF Transcript_25987/g.56641 Transcript_25987/m.56641 type:complete len:155 (+) Transcript_25987:56-520(+)|eukprot:CAMPEP_0202900564 /NCGR_PEP_ID=MMETSP1392-20130828/11909_1 /ASSEMBLY_ACC=CAM_ASM_000868 /TAXON_ID=225041 /ORGANISM="Chlamydomonas chlamydogama, Strain SAG 11-48b" /LENGTH=154 /DNA_ID=CAMNT_0049586979 /DNA_START=56 /DNA_END=520 /DNA_ORIENTATION=-
MLAKYIFNVLDATGKKSLLGLIGSLDIVKLLADGNIGYIKLVKGAHVGTLVGTDNFGNKYYENNDLPYGRKRWVVYQDTFDYNPTGISAEWHGWINGINDAPPTSHEYKKPLYAVEAYVTKTGTPAAYAPKGVWANPQKRNWRKVEVWQPPQSS